MNKHAYPQIGDRIIDKLTKIGETRFGHVNKLLHLYDEYFVEVKWDTTPYGALPEQFPYEEYFTQNNCGNGRWDAEENAWIIERSPNEEYLPDDNPFVVSLNKGFEDLNLKLCEERLGYDSKLSSVELLLKSCEYRKQADDLRPSDPYFNWYFSKAEDYAKLAAHKQEKVDEYGKPIHRAD